MEETTNDMHFNTSIHNKHSNKYGFTHTRTHLQKYASSIFGAIFFLYLPLLFFIFINPNSLKCENLIHTNLFRSAQTKKKSPNSIRVSAKFSYSRHTFDFVRFAGMCAFVIFFCHTISSVLRLTLGT